VFQKCLDCGCDFWVEADEKWKVRCYECWKEWKNGDGSNSVGKLKERVMKLEAQRNALLERNLQLQSNGAGNVRDELIERMRGLLLLVHPDKHGNSRTANEITLWLLDIKEKAASFGEHGAA
jgi:hypothetical protein